MLVTNYRDFLLVGEDANGNPARLESFRLAVDAEDFERQLEKPRAFAGRVGVALGEYLRRVLSHRARLAEPRDLAELLASHARDALARVEAAESETAGGAAPLATVRAALEEALGVQFKGERGARFFRSTLVQTLFYGVFSAWVLWARQTPPPRGTFNLARGRLAPAGTCAAGAVSAALGSRSPAAAGAGGGAGLDGGRAEPGGAGRLLRPIQRRDRRCPTSTNRS